MEVKLEQPRQRLTDRLDYKVLDNKCVSALWESHFISDHLSVHLVVIVGPLFHTPRRP